MTGIMRKKERRAYRNLGEIFGYLKSLNHGSRSVAVELCLNNGEPYFAFSQLYPNSVYTIYPSYRSLSEKMNSHDIAVMGDKIWEEWKARQR
jgi:hypothetical protein